MVDNIVKMPYNENGSWIVKVTRSATKLAKKLPQKMRCIFKVLLLDLSKFGPIQHEWVNYSKLPNGRYHCHLSYRYVAVWEIIDKEIKVLEVIYVGSRENAPY
jgi:mRNA-degrading endonuclease RelE of RelBE toxin-antitoxin system